LVNENEGKTDGHASNFEKYFGIESVGHIVSNQLKFQRPGNCIRLSGGKRDGSLLVDAKKCY